MLKQTNKMNLLPVIILCLLLNLVGGIDINLVEAASTTWVLDNYYDNPYLQVDRIRDDTILLWGEHNRKTNENYYKTDGFVLTLDDYNINCKFPASVKQDSHGIDVRKDDGPKTADKVITYYYLSFEELVGKAEELGLTGESLENGEKKIYLHTVYDIYKGDNRVVNNVIGVQEMLNAPKTYNLGYERWNPATEKRIPSYYNMCFVLKDITYKIEVIPVDKNKKPLTDKVFDTKTVILNEKYEFNLSDDKNNLTVDGKDYTYSKKWYYKFTPRGKTTTKTIDNKSDPVALNEVPDAETGSTLTIGLIYDTEEKPFYLDFMAVDSNKKKIQDLTDENYNVKHGDTYTYKVPDRWNKIKDNYNYQNKWYLSYTDTKGLKKELPIKNLKDINEKLPIDVKENSEAKFCLIYSLDETPTPSPSPTPTIPEIIVPEPDEAYLDFTEVVNTGVIRADNRGTEKFITALGIPTTESMYGEVIAKEYLLGYRFVKKVGIENYPVEVTKDYILNWKTATPESAGGSVRVTETVTIKQIITVPRAYGYWEIENLECYKIDNAILRNYALPGGTVELYPNASFYSPPSVNVTHSSDKSSHLIPPDEAVNGIKLEAEIISAEESNPTRKPTIIKEDFTDIALTKTGNIKVMSDNLIFNGRTVISNEIVETEAPDIDTSAIPQCYDYIKSKVLYKNSMIIEATKKNGGYPSSGTITYTALAKIGSIKPYNPQYSISGINTVTVHTPVICNPSISADNDKYVQLMSPDNDCVQLVLDPDPTYSDFTVHISNTGLHSSKQGYFTRDFSYSLRDSSLSYIASKKGHLRNEVRFPFDVYIDIGEDNDTSNDEYIKRDTWVIIGRSSPGFYLPTWTAEGTYIVDFRTVAVNGEDALQHSESYANTSLNNYVATETLRVEVSGRMYGLTLYDISDYPMWEETFRVPDSKDLKKNVSRYINGTDKTGYNKQYSYTYRVGTNDQYGNDTGRDIKYTFPLVNGSHPFYKNQGILKTGYIVRFSIDTIGTMFSDACSINIKPTFYFVDKNGGNRKAVDLYYTEEINGKSRHLVKIGSALDKTNIKKVMTGDLNLGIPVSELKQTAALRGTKYGTYLAYREAMFSFSNIKLTSAFRTYVGQEYLSNVRKLNSYENLIIAGFNAEQAVLSMQRWYGQYYIPNEVHAVEKGYDVMGYADKYGVDYCESFWLKDGYLIVNFAIETIDENGKSRLSYINANNYRNNGNCSMWVTEGPPLSKKNYKGPDFNFFVGDFVVYDLNKRMSDDYTSGAIY